MSSNSLSLYQIDTKFEAFRLIHDPSRLFSLLYSKYGDIEEDYYLLYINQLIYNVPKKFNSNFKEIKYSDFTFEYLKRIYKRKESINRIPKLSDYYKNYHLFFCRPTLRNRKLGALLCDYEDNKAELFYKNNYQESKEESNKISIKEKNKNNEKNSSNLISFSSLDNITNNKIIFDKETRKMLERNEADYNTLTLETSKSINISNNNALVSKRSSTNDSFEKCIHALVIYKYKNYKNKNNKISEKRKFKRKKNILINDINSNFYNNYRLDKPKNSMSHSQRDTHIKSNSINQKIQLTNIINTKFKNLSQINRNNYNRIMSSKKKKNSLFSLSNNKYLRRRTNILSSLNNIISKNEKKNINNKIQPKIEEFNLNQILITKKGILYSKNPENKKKNKTYILSGGGNVIKNTTKNKNLNIHPNIDIIKNLKLDEENSKKFSKFSEYLNHTKIKDIKDIKNNFVQQKKNNIHKKNSLSIGVLGNQNLLNNNSNNHKRVTKKRITINKNLKIALANINNTNENNNIINCHIGKHRKNKTCDYNTINSQTNNTTNFLGSNMNITNINIEEFNTIFNKPKKFIYKINTDYNYLNNKLSFNNTENITKNKEKVIKNPVLSPSTKKIYHKIPLTQTTSKEKNIHKKKLIVKIFNPSTKIRESSYNENNNTPYHKKNNYSMLISEDLLHNNFIFKFPKIKSSKNKSNNYYSNNISNNSNLIIKNISTHLSPLHNSKIISSTNKNKLRKNLSKKNTVNKTTSIYENKPIINNKKRSNILINSHNIRKNKELYSNICLITNNSNINISNSINEIKIISRNKKKVINQKSSKNSKGKIYISKKSNVINKSNSSLKNNNINIPTNRLIINTLSNNGSLSNDILQNSYKNNIINSHENINISIGENNINIKDSILHINKIFIKDNNINSINNKNRKIAKFKSGNNCCLKYNKVMETKVDDCHLKTGSNNFKKNKVKMKSINFPKTRYNYSPKIINVHRNRNLVIKKNNEKIKYKKPKLD